MGNLAYDEERGRNEPLRELFEDPSCHQEHPSAVFASEHGREHQPGRRLDAVVLLDVEAENGGQGYGKEPGALVFVVVEV